MFYAGVKSIASEDKSTGYIIINNDKQISWWIYVIKYSISGIKITSHHTHQQSITLQHLLDCNQLQFVDEGFNIPCQYQITLSTYEIGTCYSSWNIPCTISLALLGEFVFGIIVNGLLTFRHQTITTLTFRGISSMWMDPQNGNLAVWLF